MSAAQAGDSQAYRLLLGEISAVVRRIALSRWGRVDDLDDLVQDVLLSLHSVRHTYAPDRPFLPWLLAIIRNRMADAARRSARRKANEITVEFLPETFSDAQTNLADDTFGDPELLRQAIADLPDSQRQAVELLKLGEMSLKEASATSGQSVAALKVAMHRALKALKSALGQERKE
jgi:RNA polymerase sigma-70 factor (ECF subfamily)